MSSVTRGAVRSRWGGQRDLSWWLQRLPLALIRFYQLAIAPLLGPHCRFEPSCSRYASEAIERYGVLRGCGLAAKRILRCHPFTAGGIDPVR